MTRGRILFASLSIATVILVGTGTLARAVSKGTQEDSLYKSLSVFTEVLNLVRRAYVDETSVDQLFSGALDGTTDALDALATYVPEDQIDRYRQARAIGPGRSGLSVVKERGVAYILAVTDGSPGESSGLVRGDALAQIDGRSTRGMPLWEIQTLLAGEVGSVLEIEVIRRGQSLQEEITLASFEVPKPAISYQEELPVLRLASLDAAGVGIVESLLTGLARAGTDELLIDLRGLAGGSSRAAYDVADLFVSGPLGTLKNREESLESFDAEREPVWSGALVVLVDRATQGPSEILAAVLQQAAGATLVGERTFGHAGRQTGVEVSSGGRLFLADAFFTGPDEEPIRSSLEPELVVTEGNRRLSEAGVPLPELILRRGLERLREQRAESRQAA